MHLHCKVLQIWYLKKYVYIYMYFSLLVNAVLMRPYCKVLNYYIHILVNKKIVLNVSWFWNIFSATPSEFDLGPNANCKNKTASQLQCDMLNY